MVHRRAVARAPVHAARCRVEATAINSELTHHLGYEKHASRADPSGNSRHGTTPKTLRGQRRQRHSLSYVSPRDRKQVVADLKAIYQATTIT